MIGVCVYDFVGYEIHIGLPNAEPTYESHTYHPHHPSGCDRHLRRLNKADWESGYRCTCDKCCSRFESSRKRRDLLIGRGSLPTPATPAFTLRQLADKINAHLDAGGYVLDYYRDCAPSLITRAEFCEDDGYGEVVRLRCPFNDSEYATTIPDSDVLEDKGNVVTYTPDPNHTGSFLGELRFLIPG